jgi:hypothetical protein
MARSSRAQKWIAPNLPALKRWPRLVGVKEFYASPSAL